MLDYLSVGLGNSRSWWRKQIRKIASIAKEVASNDDFYPELWHKTEVATHAGIVHMLNELRSELASGGGGELGEFYRVILTTWANGKPRRESILHRHETRRKNSLMYRYYFHDAIGAIGREVAREFKQSRSLVG